MVAGFKDDQSDWGRPEGPMAHFFEEVILDWMLVSSQNSCVGFLTTNVIYNDITVHLMVKMVKKFKQKVSKGNSHLEGWQQ
jgi:hypothetical protein